jgi:hypothetical protein
VNYRLVGPTDIRIPISDSVRAATWDELGVKPKLATHVRLACIVIRINGGAGNCIPAARLPQGQKTVDWAKALDDATQAGAGSPEELALRNAATDRIDTALLVAQPHPDTLLEIRIFDEVISPQDVRPPFVAANTLSYRNVAFAHPLDPTLLADLYPAGAVRNSVDARVSVTCHVEPSLKLLCRDPGTFEVLNEGVARPTTYILHSLLFATYQAASTVRLEPKTKDGHDAAGQNLTITLHWKIPDQ